MPNKHPLVNSPLAWSFSRHNQRVACTRMYYYLRYVAVHGWKPGASKVQKEVSAQSLLSSVPQWIGEACHNSFEDLANSLRTGGRSALSKEEWEGLVAGRIASLKDNMVKEFTMSARCAEKGIPPTKFRRVLRGHYEGKEVDLNSTLEKAETVFRGIAGNLYKLLSEAPFRIVAVETLDKLPGNYGCDVWVKADLVVELEGKGLFILDYKTGRRRAENVSPIQLAIYSRWARERFNTPYGAVRTALIFSDITEHFPPMSESDVKSIDFFIKESIREQKGLLKKVKTNEPKGIKSFPRCSPDLTSPACNWCNFQSQCIADGK